MTIAMRSDPVPVRVCIPEPGLVRGVLAYYPDTNELVDAERAEGFARSLAARTACSVVILGNSGPFAEHAVAVDTAWAGLRWTTERVSILAGSRAPIIVVGVGFGAHLAAVTTHRARNAGLRSVALQLLVSPTTDCDDCTQHWIGEPGRSSDQQARSSVMLAARDDALIVSEVDAFFERALRWGDRLRHSTRDWSLVRGQYWCEGHLWWAPMSATRAGEAAA